MQFLSVKTINTQMRKIY